MERRTAGGFLRDAAYSIFQKLRANTLLRWVGMPFQRVFDKIGDTHRFLTVQSIDILRADGYERAAGFCESYKDELIQGTYWADSLWKNATHHYNPRTGRGLLVWPGATDQLKYWFKAALNYWRKGNIHKAMFTLGACVHVVQDSCQPYHSNCKMLGGHQKYEIWADKNKEQFAVSSGGMYDLSDTPEGWVVQNAQYSSGLLPAICGVTPDSGEERIRERHRVTGDLLARAQRTSAGFILFFLRKALETGSLPQNTGFSLDGILERT
ncbi:MAG TPA: phospholipase [Firmicutes bacterium]|nr:phospholipase [Candidatus Fermentithermobacillaceae bacterium]